MGGRIPRCVSLWGPAIVVLMGLPGPAAADSRCADELQVVGATATYQTRTFQGRPRRRDARVQVQLRSTSTSAITAIDLGIFLGASLRDVQATRGSALPTRQPRVFDEGGMAFRARVELVLPAGATRTVEVQRRAVPIEQDLYGVKAVVVGCSKMLEVANVRLVMPAEGADPPAWILITALLTTVGIAFMVLRRLR